MNNVKEDIAKGTKLETSVVEITTPVTIVKGAVKITDIDIPFFSMMGLMFKLGFAAIPVFIVISLLWYTLKTLIGL